MMIKQVSVFLENKVGRLENILEVLYQYDINLRSISVAETTDYGIIRLILDKPELAIEKLKEAGFMVKETRVLALEISDITGSMLSVIKELSANDISVEYTYSSLPLHGNNVIIIIRVDDNEKAIEVLKDSKNAKLLNIEELV